LSRSLKPLILHIGLGKTGTTVLQQFFTSNTEALRTLGIDYPAEGLADHAHHLFSPHVPHYMKHRWQFEEVGEWAARLSRTEFPSVLLSSELMSSAKEEELKHYFSVLNRFFAPRVVVYLRRQDHLLASIYNQQVKSGRQKRPLSAILLRQIPKHNALNTLKLWERAVGREAMIVRPYEKDRFHGGDIRSDFMFRVFGVDLVEQFALSPEDPNPAFPYAVLEYKRTLNWVVKDRVLHQRCNRVLAAYVESQERSRAEVGNNAGILSVNERLAVLGALAGANAEVARRYGVCDQGQLFREPLPDPNSEMAWSEPSADQASEIYQFFLAHDELAAEQIELLALQQGEPEGEYHRAAIESLKRSFG